MGRFIARVEIMSPWAGNPYCKVTNKSHTQIRMVPATPYVIRKCRGNGVRFFWVEENQGEFHIKEVAPDQHW